MRRIILASASPRRKVLLERAGICFEVCPSGGEEHISSEAPEEVVKELALQKAHALEKEAENGTLIIGADTVVAYRSKILGKPAGPEEAVKMLTMLQGNTHQVYTGVAILIRREERWDSFSFSECTDVTFYPVSESEIREYVATGDPLDKAGSFGIQGPFGAYVKEIRGDYQNVVGLPVPRILFEMKKLGLDLRVRDFS